MLEPIAVDAVQAELGAFCAAFHFRSHPAALRFPLRGGHAFAGHMARLPRGTARKSDHRNDSRNDRTPPEIDEPRRSLSATVEVHGRPFLAQPFGRH